MVKEIEIKRDSLRCSLVNNMWDFIKHEDVKTINELMSFIKSNYEIIDLKSLLIKVEKKKFSCIIMDGQKRKIFNVDKTTQCFVQVIEECGNKVKENWK
jgi:hypothetical protein